MQALFQSLSLRQQAALALGVLLAGFLLGLVTDPRGLRRWWSLGGEIIRVQGENDVLRREVELMQRKTRALQGDAQALERAARENGYVREDEILFELR
jgi:cell division protein FtsB